jgi:hypothetical protein
LDPLLAGFTLPPQFFLPCTVLELQTLSLTGIQVLSPFSASIFPQ